MSVIARTAHHVLVVGTGDSYGTDGRVAENVLVPFLRRIGVSEVEALVSGESTASSAGVICAARADAGPADFRRLRNRQHRVELG